MLQYILEVTLCWALFYTIFFGFLRKLTFFSVNRWYLLGTMVLGILIPLLRYIELDLYQEEIAQTIPVAIAVKELPAQVAITVEEATIAWSSIIYNFLMTLYLIGVSFFGARMLRSIYRIYRLNRNGQHEDQGHAAIVYTNADHLPFSFFRHVYISRQVDLTENFEEVLQHEIAHVRSYHSVDVLLMELIQISFWFNPMVYIYKTALRQTHEYLADQAVLQNTNRKTYGTMLLKQSLSGLEIALTHRFFHSHIKKRINMMYQKKSGRSAWLKYALALPVLFVLTVVFANHSSINGTHKESQLSTNPYTCESSDIQLFTEVDQEPYFSDYDRTLSNVDEIHKSAFNNLNQYLYNHISSDIELHNKVKGKWVEVNMTVTKYGKINDLTILMGVDQRADQKLLDLFIDLNKKDMPFIPAIKDGEAVSAIMTIPFMFVEDGQGLIHLPFKRFKKYRLKKELNDVIQTIGQDRRKITPSIEKITKKYLTKFPKEHRDVISTLTVWGWENGYRIQPISESIIIKGYSQKGNYPIGDVKSLTLDISTMNRDNLKFSHSGFEDFSSITKDNIKELIHVIYDNSPSSSQCLKDFLKFSYPHRDRNDLQEIIIERFKEVLDNEDITVYQDFEKLELSINTNLPDELISLSNYSIDEEIMPIIWTQEFDNSQLLEEFIDFDKPIKAIYHLPAKEATKIFGDRGSKGFYALMGYERPRTHPTKQKEMLEFELDNFYTTLMQTNERGWVTKLKDVHQQLQQKYPKVSDWITPFTTRAHDHGIMLVIKNDEIVKAYKETNSGLDQIDQYSQIVEKTDALSTWGKSMISSDGIDELLHEINTTHNMSRLDIIKNFYQTGIKKYPMVVVDGETKSMSDLYDLEQGQISSLDMITSASAIDKYGSQAEHGAIIIQSLQDDKIYKVVQEMPRFPGCELKTATPSAKKECADQKLLDYIYENLKYPKAAMTDKIEGRVYIQFVIEKDGSISNTKIVRGIGGGCADAAREVIENMNNLYERWIPGKQQGKAVRVLYTIPVTFKMSNNKEPLHVIDGQIVDEATANKLNPNDIEKVTVVKGQDAINKYGAKATNGVVEISLKRKTATPEKDLQLISNDSKELKPLIVIDGKVVKW